SDTPLARCQSKCKQIYGAFGDKNDAQQGPSRPSSLQYIAFDNDYKGQGPWSRKEAVSRYNITKQYEL
ncbi:MAG: hypothetical protein Q9177_005404, partial [Variospora cf. flavescens]